MKERPILFQTDMVRAVLEGKKTMTRRLIKPHDRITQLFDFLSGHENETDGNGEDLGQRVEGDRLRVWCNEYPEEGSELIKCPYGIPGDRLYVRESFAIKNDIKGFPYLIFKTDSIKDDSGEKEGYWIRDRFFPGEIKWRPSIHLPQLSSRITLEIVNVRVERVQEINEEDAIAEGIARQIAHGKDLGWRNYLWHGDFGIYGYGNKKTDAWDYQYSTYLQAVDCFSSLWELINGPGAWKRNDWVYVIEFKII